jgi:hypothetical protein
MIVTIMKNYELGNVDMQRTINTLRNIILSFKDYDEAFKIIKAG